MDELKKCQPVDISVINAIVSLDPFRRLEGTLVFLETLNTELSAQGLEGSVLGAGDEERTPWGSTAQWPSEGFNQCPQGVPWAEPRAKHSAWSQRPDRQLTSVPLCCCSGILDWIVYKDQEFGTPSLLSWLSGSPR